MLVLGVAIVLYALAVLPSFWWRDPGLFGLLQFGVAFTIPVLVGSYFSFKHRQHLGQWRAVLAFSLVQGYAAFSAALVGVNVDEKLYLLDIGSRIGLAIGVGLVFTLPVLLATALFGWLGLFKGVKNTR